jgi:indolepyruvate ferredoxin oxidoreductase alpha subunit
VEQFFLMDPFDLEGSTETIRHALTLPGVKVILARQECAIQAQRRGERAGNSVRVVDEKCNQCKLCIQVTGCAAIALTGNSIAIDPALCYGCNLCADVCNRDAILTESTLTQVGVC